MKVQRIVEAIESLAPPQLAADWDNVGLLVGDSGATVGKIVLCIDLSEAVLAEAVRAKSQMVMAYHPVIFKSVSRVTTAAAPVLYEAIRRGLAVYSTHTALDAAPGGTNDVLAEAMGLSSFVPLEPVVRSGQRKVVTFVPGQDLHRVAEAAFAAGAGRVGNYHDCAFFGHGIGTFCGLPGTHPSIGMPGHHEAAEEMRFEVIAPQAAAAEVCRAIRAAHSYETPAIDVYPLEDLPANCGMGRIGRLPRAVKETTLINRVKKAIGLNRVLVARPGGASGAAKSKRSAGSVSVVACGAGSCGSLWKKAAAAGAQFYLTGEIRHHDALAAAAAGMTVACVGHSNSERIALSGLAARLGDVLPGLRVVVSKQDRDPFEIV